MEFKKSLDRKLAAIHADPQGSREFILADAKDADMAFGVVATGQDPGTPEDGGYRSLQAYREQMRQIVRQGLVDIMLMSASSSEQLTLKERLFDESPVTPAIRANDATDVHAMRGSRIPMQPARPFRTASLDHVQCGHIDCEMAQRSAGVDLGLYSVTFNNDVELDRETLEAYREFRDEAERKGFRHFLEVFHPNVPDSVPDTELTAFVNDAIARTLAGVTSSARPIFLKIPYPGPAALEELVAFDPHLIVGILGGSAGTTRDAFQLVEDSRRYGARAALFGRKINNSENQLAFIEFLYRIANGELGAEEAVVAYHAVLKRLGVTPRRSLDEDQQITEAAMNYAGTGRTVSLPSAPDSSPNRAATAATPSLSENGAAVAGQTPDFARMTPQQRLEYHLKRIRGTID